MSKIVRGRPGQTSPWLAIPTIAYLFLTIGIPLFITVVYSFLQRAKIGMGVTWHFSPKAYKDLFILENLDGTTTFDTRYVKVLWHSFQYSAVTTVATVVLSIPIAMWIATRNESTRNILVAAVTLPFWISILIRTYGLRQIIDDNGPIGWIAHKLGSFLQSDMLGGGKTNMIANVIALNFTQARNWPFGCALSVLLILLTLLLVQAIRLISKKFGDQVSLV